MYMIKESEASEVLGMKKFTAIFDGLNTFFRSRKKLSSVRCDGFVKRCKKYLTPTILLTIYVTYIRPKV